jgi:hypothetical protein
MPLLAKVRESPEPMSSQNMALIIRVKKAKATKVEINMLIHMTISKGHNKAKGLNTLAPSEVT